VRTTWTVVRKRVPYRGLPPRNFYRLVVVPIEAVEARF
jgi:hypothetical protein